MSEWQKTAVIFGLANKRSIAWAIAQKLQQAGWRLAICYQNERLEQEAKDLIADLPGAEGFMCDVTQDDQIAQLFEELEREIRSAARIGAQRRLRAGERFEGRFREHHARGISYRARHQCLFADCRIARRVAADDRWRRHRHPDVLRRGKSRATIQRDGRCESGAGSDGSLSRVRSWTESDSR